VIPKTFPIPILKKMYRYRPFFPNSMFYPCSAFDGFFIRTINSAPKNYKTADFLHVDNNHGNRRYDLNSAIKLFAKFKKKLNRIPYYKFEQEPIPLNKVTKTDYLISIDDDRINAIQQEFAEIELNRQLNTDEWTIFLDCHLHEEIEEIKNAQHFCAVYRGAKKAIFKGKEGHSVIYVMFVFAEAFEFYQHMFVQRGTTPKVFAEKHSCGVFAEIQYDKIGSKWIISDRLNKNDNLNAYTRLDSLHAGWMVQLQVFKQNIR